jgi:signal transduction histidine kinase/ligand-binding sensor domain-containing protein
VATSRRTVRHVAWCVLTCVLASTVFALSVGEPGRSQLETTFSKPVLQAQDDPHSLKLPIVEGHDLRFRRLSVAQGLSQTRVSAIVQDNLGFLWFGTQYGLDRYDGYKFKVFAREPGRSNSLSGVFVRSLFKDRDGILWVGCDQYLDKFDSATETFTHYSVKAKGENSPGATVNHISQGRSGVLWLSTKEGLYSLEPTTGVIERYVHDPKDPRSLSSNEIQSTGEDREGKLWVSTIEGLDAYNPATKTVSLHIPEHGEGRQVSFLEDSFGVFWIFHAAGGGGLSVYDRRTNKLSHYVFDPPPGSKADATGFVYMLEDRDKNLWLASATDGLYEFDRKHQRFIRYRNEPNNGESLSDDQLLTLLQDREGNIWVGLEQLAPNYFSTKPTAFERFVHQPGTANSLGASLVSSIYEDHKAILWISSSASLNRMNRRTGENRLVFRGINEAEIYSMMEDSAGVLWAGTAGQGIRQIEQATGQFKPHISKLFDLSNADGQPVTRLLADRDGTMWATTWDGLRHFDFARSRYTLYRPPMQVAAEYYDMARDAKGILWLGSKVGLQRFDPATGSFKVYTHHADDPHSLSDPQVDAVYFDRSGTMWVGTQDGLDKFDPKTESFEIYREKEGLPGNVINCILSDARNNLWMSTNNGLSRFDRVSGHFRNYSVADGLSGADLTGWGACFKSRTGEMFFGGFSGATAFYPDKVVDSAEAPTIVLTDFSLSGTPVGVGPHSLLEKAISSTDKLTLSHRQNIFSIEFSALSYLNSATNRYRYKLDGLDKDWHEVNGDQRQASYTTLPSATYTFRVQGSVSGGPWGEPGTILQITVLPPWWNTWWFRTLYITTALLVLWSAYRLHLRQIALQHNIRLQERLAERSRIARELHDTLLQGFQGLMLLFQGVIKTLPADAHARQLMEIVMDRGDQVLLEGRQSVRDLREDATTAEDLAESLKRCGQEFAQDHEIPFSFGVIGTPRSFDPILCNEASRIGREALTNAFLHSGATRIEAEIAYRNSCVSLTVRDDGRGIDQRILDGGRSGHWGLRGMRERAAEIGAELVISSRPGAGTEVVLTIPTKVA